jgi:hypothetical protein
VAGEGVSLDFHLRRDCRRANGLFPQNPFLTPDFVAVEKSNRRSLGRDNNNTGGLDAGLKSSTTRTLRPALPEHHASLDFFDSLPTAKTHSAVRIVLCFDCIPTHAAIESEGLFSDIPAIPAAGFTQNGML